jgi:hypothetical protein
VSPPMFISPLLACATERWHTSACFGALVFTLGCLPVLSQVIPAFFRPFPTSSDGATSCWKAHCWAVEGCPRS